jgi:hypothetical protein
MSVHDGDDMIACSLALPPSGFGDDCTRSGHEVSIQGAKMHLVVDNTRGAVSLFCIDAGRPVTPDVGVILWTI